MSDDKIQNMTTRVGGECRMEDIITGPEKPVYWTNHSGTEDRNRVGNSEPKAMALMNGENNLRCTVDDTPEFSGWIRSTGH